MSKPQRGCCVTSEVSSDSSRALTFGTTEILMAQWFPRSPVVLPLAEVVGGASSQDGRAQLYPSGGQAAARSHTHLLPSLHCGPVTGKIISCFQTFCKTTVESNEIFSGASVQDG